MSIHRQARPLCSTLITMLLLVAYGHQNVPEIPRSSFSIFLTIEIKNLGHKLDWPSRKDKTNPADVLNDYIIWPWKDGFSHQMYRVILSHWRPLFLPSCLIAQNITIRHLVGMWDITPDFLWILPVYRQLSRPLLSMAYSRKKWQLFKKAPKSQHGTPKELFKLCFWNTTCVRLLKEF